MSCIFRRMNFITENYIFPKTFSGNFFFFFFFKFEIRKEIRFAFCFSTGNYGRVAKPEDEFSLFPDYVNKCMISEKYRYK